MFKSGSLIALVLSFSVTANAQSARITAQWLQCFGEDQTPFNAYMASDRDSIESVMSVTALPERGQAYLVEQQAFGNGVDGENATFRAIFEPRTCDATWIDYQAPNNATAYELRAAHIEGMRGGIRSSTPSTDALHRLLGVETAEPASVVNALSRLVVGFSCDVEYSASPQPATQLSCAQPFFPGTPRTSAGSFWPGVSQIPLSDRPPNHVGTVAVGFTQQPAVVFQSRSFVLYEVVSGDGLAVPVIVDNFGPLNHAFAIYEPSLNRHRWIMTTSTAVGWLGVARGFLFGVGSSAVNWDSGLFAVELRTGTAFRVSLPNDELWCGDPATYEDKPRYGTLSGERITVMCEGNPPSSISVREALQAIARFRVSAP